MFKSLKLWWCRRFHMEHWHLIEHGHRRCSKCKVDWKRSSSAPGHTSRERARMPR